MVVQLFNFKTEMTHLFNIKHLFVIIFSIISHMTYAQFPYYNSAQEATLFEKIQGSTDLTFNKNDGAVLTQATKSQKSGIVLKYLKKGTTNTFEDLTFTTDKGFIIEFEYSIIGGIAYDKKYGDGFALVLFDSEVTNPTLGAPGGGLGYTPSNNRNSSTPGFSKGFLGLGFDLFGNYKAKQTGSESWFNGIVAGDVGNYISLRGPYNPSNSQGGYPVLFSVGTSNLENYFLDIKTGLVRKTNMAISGGFFTLDVTKNPKEIRKARIALIPGTEANTNRKGFYISLNVQHGAIKTNVIKDYFFPTDGSHIKFPEKRKASEEKIEEMVMHIPKTLKMAFTASTGGATAKQSIKNIHLSLPYSAVALDDAFTISNSLSSSISPILNDYGFNHNVYSIYNPPSQSFKHLDLTSFQFQLLDNVSNSFKNAENPYQVNYPNIGTFTYNPTDGKIYFVPSNSFDNSVNDIKLYYNIKNKKEIVEGGGNDISTDEFRSNTATIKINFDKSAKLKPVLIINKGIRNL